METNLVTIWLEPTSVVVNKGILQRIVRFRGNLWNNQTWERKTHKPAHSQDPHLLDRHIGRGFVVRLPTETLFRQTCNPNTKLTNNENLGCRV